MDLTFSDADEAFREEVRAWLTDHLVGEFAALGPGGELGEGTELETRRAWEHELASGGWVGMGWPAEYGGRELPLTQQLIFHEEYVRAGGPQRISFFGEELLGPTLMVFGTEEQKQRFLPPILAAEEFWCQGFSEPDAGSDLANVKTTALRDGDEWVINGQKAWTSLGHMADWIFVVCRTDPAAAEKHAKKPAKKHDGISFLLCEVDQPGIEMRPIRQITGGAEFNEVFFTDARTSADLVVGPVGEGWKVVMGTLGFERGTAFLGEQLRWARARSAARAVGPQARRGSVSSAKRSSSSSVSKWTWSVWTPSSWYRRTSSSVAPPRPLWQYTGIDDGARPCRSAAACRTGSMSASRSGDMTAVIQPSPSRTARAIAASLCPPTRIGIGCWTGLGSGSIGGMSQNSPWNSTCCSGAVQMARSSAIDSSARAPRRSHGMFMTSASSFSQPTPVPTSSRPPEYRSMVAS
jgi:hypothetical protein